MQDNAPCLALQTIAENNQPWGRRSTPSSPGWEATFLEKLTRRGFSQKHPWRKSRRQMKLSPSGLQSQTALNAGIQTIAGAETAKRGLDVRFVLWKR